MGSSVLLWLCALCSVLWLRGFLGSELHPGYLLERLLVYPGCVLGSVLRPGWLLWWGDYFFGRLGRLLRGLGRLGSLLGRLWSLLGRLRSLMGWLGSELGSRCLLRCLLGREPWLLDLLGSKLLLLRLWLSCSLWSKLWPRSELLGWSLLGRVLGLSHVLRGVLGLASAVGSVRSRSSVLFSEGRLCGRFGEG